MARSPGKPTQKKQPDRHWNPLDREDLYESLDADPPVQIHYPVSPLMP